MEIDISDTGVRIDGIAADGLQIEQLIARLARVRATTAPEVTPNLRGLGRVDVCPDPTFVTGRTIDHQLHIAFRHTGIGWLVFALPIEKAALIRKFIAARTEHVPVDVLHQDHPEPGSAH